MFEIFKNWLKSWIKKKKKEIKNKIENNNIEYLLKISKKRIIPEKTLKTVSTLQEISWNLNKTRNASVSSSNVKFELSAILRIKCRSLTQKL